MPDDIKMTVVIINQNTMNVRMVAGNPNTTSLVTKSLPLRPALALKTLTNEMYIVGMESR